MNHLKAFQACTHLIDQIGESSAYLVWAMGIYLEEPDLVALASECLTDGIEDKKIDFIRIDRDSRRIVCAQGYFAQKPKDVAPTNKASDLNTAAAWFFSGDLKDVPSKDVPASLRSIIKEGRQAVDDGEIDTLELLYVHNVSESINVAKELNTVAAHLRKLASSDTSLSIIARELGVENIERLFTSQESPIEVRDEIECPAKVQFTEQGPSWKAAVLTVPGIWLHRLIAEHGDKLFSANYRGFLGISRRKKVNQGIRQSAENQPKDFWVFNNGITVMTLGVTPKNGSTVLSGISIINGAQTTGSLGSLDSQKADLTNVRVLCRAIVCEDPHTLDAIVKYNNTQNEITTWDTYSNSPEQERIETEFNELGHVYSRKRGARRAYECIGIEEVAQPLLAFEGHFEDANRGKNAIFERKALYKTAFDGKHARHILFAYTLANAIDSRRIELKTKSIKGTIIGVEQQQLPKLRNLRFKNFAISVIAKCLETVLGHRVDMPTVSFSKAAASRSSNSIVELSAAWRPVVDSVLTFICTFIDDDVSESLRQQAVVDTIAAKVNALIYAGRGNLGFENFVRLVDE